MKTQTWLSFNWLKILAIILVLGAFAQLSFLPYAYYQLMNWAVMVAGLVTAEQAYKQDKRWVMWIFLLVAIVFNPISPIFLQPNIWLVADVSVAVLFLISLFVLRPKS